ncbi:hypothetical protein EVAR_50989_1 [Eumeta japonica]|uniref:Uncharacterized protein n=1 Tax=Eumeta variegata TaxID=151549 RepID=A0A4C1ZXQ5_EUMVA|nr:hypothetical protein EVAR_50989_1 [Eumeta japonica]
MCTDHVRIANEPLPPGARRAVGRRPRAPARAPPRKALFLSSRFAIEHLSRRSAAQEKEKSKKNLYPSFYINLPFELVVNSRYDDVFQDLCIHIFDFKCKSAALVVAVAAEIGSKLTGCQSEPDSAKRMRPARRAAAAESPDRTCHRRT